MRKDKKTSERFDWIITEGNSENDGTEVHRFLDLKQK